MSNIVCAKCGEPWDNYGLDHGDVDEGDGDKIRKGQGCPICAFGTRCTECYGRGHRRLSDHKCFRCNGTGEFIPEKEGDYLFEALESLVESTDEDPLDLLINFELG